MGNRERSSTGFQARIRETHILPRNHIQNDVYDTGQQRKKNDDNEHCSKCLENGKNIYNLRYMTKLVVMVETYRSDPYKPRQCCNCNMFVYKTKNYIKIYMYSLYKRSAKQQQTNQPEAPTVDASSLPPTQTHCSQQVIPMASANERRICQITFLERNQHLETEASAPINIERTGRRYSPNRGLCSQTFLNPSNRFKMANLMKLLKNNIAHHQI